MFRARVKKQEIAESTEEEKPSAESYSQEFSSIPDTLETDIAQCYYVAIVTGRGGVWINSLKHQTGLQKKTAKSGGNDIDDLFSVLEN